MQIFVKTLPGKTLTLEDTEDVPCEQLRLFFASPGKELDRTCNHQSLEDVGAGIAGLAAATALRRNGHHVQIFEAVEIKGEIGAGITMQANALRVLHHLGYSRENLHGVDYDGTVLFKSHGTTGTTLPALCSSTQGQYHSLSCLRSDLRDELLRLAVGDEGEGPPAKLNLGSRIAACDVEEGNLTLDNGQVVHADIILGADGINMGWVTEGIPGARSVIADEESYRMIFVYTCRGGSVVNLVGIYEDTHQADPGWSSRGTQEEFMDKFKDFDPAFQRILVLTDKCVLKWQLRAVPTLHTWIRGRAALVGDAAHGTLPLLGQGAAMAIEEAGALGCMFPRGTRRADVPARLAAYQALRKQRGEFVNTESVLQGSIRAKRGEFARSHDMQVYILEYDAIKAAQECYREHFGGED
ncbi:FAD/NAD(P)-binding domain-containing protein [Mycena rebaudengoi]|nr:FAD/NAD(P)-binding domain-containing protein [Mycena rebaudengoi]